MKKIFLLIFLLNAAFSIKLTGQVATATLGDFTCATGTELVIPVKVTNFTDVAAITLYFEYDPTVVSFNRTQESALSGLDAYGAEADGIYRVAIAWAPGQAATMPDGTLVEIVFDYLGGSGDFTWLENICEVATLPDYNIIPVVYTSGSVSPSGDAEVWVVDQFNQTPGITVNVPLNVNFSGVTEGVSSFQFVLPYDDSKLTYNLVDIKEAAFNNMVVYALSNPTRLVFDWEINDLFAEVGSKFNGHLLDIEFAYAGGNTTLEFDVAGSSMADNNVVEVSVLYTGGQITQNPATAITMSLPHLVENPGTDNVAFPLSVTNFNNVGSFELHIQFDPAVLTFVGLDNYLSPITAEDFQINEVGSKIIFNWIGATLNVESGDLFNIVFDYSTGTSELLFDEDLCEIADASLDLIPLSVIYEGGSISEHMVYEATATIPDWPAVVGQPVAVPVYVTGFENVGAVNFEIVFNTGVLSFLEVGGLNPQLDGNGTYNASVTGNTLFFDWVVDHNLAQGPDVPDNEILFFMHFTYNGGTSELNFNIANCAVSRADQDITPILVTYTDGSVYGGFLTLEVVSGGDQDQQGKVQIGEDVYGPGTHTIPVTQPEILLEATNGIQWRIYSWNDDGDIDNPLGAQTYLLSMEPGKTVVAKFHLPGDANCDGKITISDATTIVSFINSLNPATFCFENADVNRDGNISVTDITLIVNTILNP